MNELMISPQDLHQWLYELWQAAGCSPHEAELVADHLVLANLSGHDSHGVGMVPRYVQAWEVGELKPNQPLSVLQDSGVLLGLDAHGGFGQAQGKAAMALAIDRAKEQGLCVMSLRHSHHLGRIGHWAEQACAAEMMSIHFVNVLSRPIVAPFGGKHARYGTNPLTIGIPRAGGPPFLLDFATSAIAMGKVNLARNKGRDVPPGCLLDADGLPTTDPKVLFPPTGGRAGALRSFAEHKGYALAFMCELLAGALTGGHTVRPETLAHQFAIWNNMFTIVIDPAVLVGVHSFNGETAAFIEWLRSSELMPGCDQILMPGDAEWQRRRQRAQGIVLDRATLDQLDQAAYAVEARCSEGPGPLSQCVM